MDSSYCLLTSLEFLDEKGELKRKADIFSKENHSENRTGNVRGYGK